MWIVCITSVRHVLTVNGYGGRQTKENEKSWCFKGWETLDNEFAQGVGLGLSICKVIVGKMQGRIEVTSEINKGSRFTVVLPCL